MYDYTYQNIEDLNLHIGAAHGLTINNHYYECEKLPSNVFTNHTKHSKQSPELHCNKCNYTSQEKLLLNMHMKYSQDITPTLL